MFILFMIYSIVLIRISHLTVALETDKTSGLTYGRSPITKHLILIDSTQF